MVIDRFLRLVPLALVAVMIGFSGCERDPDGVIEDPPIDSDPQITLLSPEQGYALVENGQSVSINWECQDNELLNAFWVTTKVFNSSGVEIFPETEVPGTYQVLSTNSITKAYTYQAPQSYPWYTTIEVRGYAMDNKGKQDVSLFKVNIVPPQDSSTQYLIQEYPDGDTIYSVLTGSNYWFDIYNRISGDPNTTPSFPMANAHIGELSTGTFQGIIGSPASTPPMDSVVVWTNTSAFNYDELTYETVWQAFVTSNQIGTTAGPLAADDIVIIKLLNTPHYAIIRVKEKNVAGGYLVFEYKYSYQ